MIGERIETEIAGGLDIPLPKMPIIESDVVRYIDVDEEFKKNAVLLGYHVKHGVVTNNLTYLPLNKLPQDMAIFGKSGIGKTFFLARMLQ